MIRNDRVKAGVLVAGTLIALISLGRPINGQCADAKDSACQPPTFRTPLEQMPTKRVNREGKLDPKSSSEDARAGALLLMKKLGLMRNFEHLHWVPLIESAKDAQGNYSGGDLDGDGTGRSFTLGGNCIFLGNITSRAAGKGLTRPMFIFKIQADPVKNAPVKVAELAPPPGTNVDGSGVDDKEVRSLIYAVAPGQDRQIMIRLVDGILITYNVDMNTCVPTAASQPFELIGDPHEFYLWHDPANEKRIVVFMSMTGAGIPDPKAPGKNVPDAYSLAITDDITGAVMPSPLMLGGFSLQEAGGPPIDERPDATGLFSDGRFNDYSHLKGKNGDVGQFARRQSNSLHSLTVSDDGERVYVAGGTAGFYILNSEAIAKNRNAALAAGTAGCNQRPTVVSAGGIVDATKLPAIANDCMHMVVHDDPGLKAFLASNASPQAKTQRYLGLLTRSRLDVHPPLNSSTGIHSAIPIPNRTSLTKGNTKNRPAYAFLTDENMGCPYGYARFANVENEAFPMMEGAFATSSADIQECLDYPAVQPDGQTKRLRQNFQAHNGTVFKNLVFLGQMGDGVRVFDISRIQSPREVGHALAVPSANNSGSARGYPVFKDGLMYWHDIGNGLHVARYIGPRADELPKSGVYDSNSTSPHR